MKILNFGSLNMDHVYQIDHFVQPGETLNVRDYQKNAGGKGLNQSIALARAGAWVYHAGQIGQDGLFLQSMLEQNGVDIRYLRTVQGPTGHAVIQVTPTGQNCILVYEGANKEVSLDHAKGVFSAFDPGDFALFQNEVAALPQLVVLAKEAGMRVILNPSPVSPILRQVDLSLVDYFILNEIEGKALTGFQDPIEILDELQHLYPAAGVVLTLGSAGAYYGDRDMHLFQEACSVKAVDTTAAGDTFTGFFFARLMGGDSPTLALRCATKAASVAVSRKGAAVSIPQLSEL